MFGEDMASYFIAHYLIFPLTINANN